MTFLPVAMRELSVAARRRSTWVVRLVAALVTILLGGAMLVLHATGAVPFGPAELGQFLFTTLTLLGLGAALSAGLFLTSDCLSGEKREGTLGLLFLTDLRGHDVVLGKLVASSLTVVLALLGILPVLGIALLAGGVTGGQFARTAFALANALFVSLAAGMLASAVGRGARQSMFMALLLIAILCGAGPALGAPGTSGAAGPWLQATSPVMAFLRAEHGSGFPVALGLTHGAGWVMLGLSSVLLPRAWQTGTQAVEGGRPWWRRLRLGGERTRLRLRARLLPADPVGWLAGRERWMSVAVAAAGVVLGLGLVGAVVSDSLPGWMVWSYLAGGLNLVLDLGVTAEAARFLLETRRSGLLESLLITPVPAREIVHGPWRALCRRLGWPLVLVLGLQCVGTAVFQRQMFRQTSGALAAATATATAAATAAAGGSLPTNTMSVGAGNPPVPAVTNRLTFSATDDGTLLRGGRGATTVTPTPTLVPGPVWELWLPAGLAVTATIGAVGNLLALVWFGMWSGLNSRALHLAILKTVAFVQVIPWFVVTFVTVLMVPLVLLPVATGGSGPAWFARAGLVFPLLFAAVSMLLHLIKDIGFVVWSRRRLLRDLRESVTRPATGVPPLLPPRLCVATPRE